MWSPAADAAKRAIVRKLFALLLCFGIALSVGLGPVAHAMEPAAASPAAAAFGHLPGDGDEVPADTDKAYPHHHAACHDHQVGVPAVEAIGVTCLGSTAIPLSPLAAFVPDARLDAPRRPPRA